MASNTTMTSSKASETSSTAVTTSASTPTTETKAPTSKKTATDSFVKKTNETTSLDGSRMAITSNTAAPDTIGHYQPRQDEIEQHQKAKSSSTTSAAEAAKKTIRTLNELLALPTDMELCQIQLIYRAEGNANLVLALPQFKKVLRLPKSAAISSANVENESVDADDLPKRKCSKIQQQQQKLQQPHKQAEIASATTATRQSLKVDLTMKDFATYMQILRHFVGTGFVLNADICWIPQETDRKWINKHISSARPPHRLDKEFCGQFGLLLPDAAQLPALPTSTPPPISPSKQTTKPTDILHSNLQGIEELSQRDAAAIAIDNNTYAIEIKPKQGWLLYPNPNTASSTIETSQVNVSDLYDIRQPATTAAATQMASLISSTPTAAKVAKTTAPVSRCRYCAMQFLKLKNRKISKLSSYCPIELFSGVPSRMLAALDALFECPQNNLRVFKNGILIYGDHASSISYKELCNNIFKAVDFQHVKQLLIECLLRNYDDYVSGYKAMEPKTKMTDSRIEDTNVVVVGSPHSSSLAKVEERKDQALPTPTKIAVKTKSETETETKASNKSSEKKQETQTTTMATVKMEMLTPVTRATTTIRTTEMETSATAVMQAQIGDAEMQSLPKNCILQKILHLQLLVKHNSIFMQQAEFGNYTKRTYKALSSLFQKTMPLSLDDLTPCEQYLLGATALDCSIMIAFQKCSNIADQLPNTQIVKLPNAGFEFITKVTLLDLDPKPDSHFCKYIQQNKEAYAALKEL